MISRIYKAFPLLLQLEWLILCTAGFMEVWLPFHGSWSLLLPVTAISALGLIGLHLPTTGKFSYKLLYTTVEFVLILLPAIQTNLSTRAVFLLCLVVLMRSCLIFTRAGQLIVLSLCFFSYSILLLSKPIVLEKLKVTATVWDWRLSNVLLFGLTLVFALLLINALLAERESREQLEKVYQELDLTNQQLRQYALRVEDQATLQERNRIAREIHDGLGHTIVAQTIQLNNALLFWQSNNDKTLIALKQAKQLASDALLEIRKSISVLRSNPLQGQSLEVAVQKLLLDFEQRTGVEVQINIDLPIPIPLEVKIALYRIVQESLTNISKYADAKTVKVELLLKIVTIYLSITDDGQGFDPTQNTTGFGIQGMRERASALQGQFSLSSQQGGGCHLSVSLPLTVR